MTCRIDLRPRARADLRQIADYTDARWARAQSKAYLGRTAGALDRIAERPEAGSDRSEVSPGLRKWRSGEHAIYYRIAEDAVATRVVHVRMDLGEADWEG